MAIHDAVALDRTFAALADPTRRAIVERLAQADRLSVSALAMPFAMSLPAVLKHVGILNEAGLVSREKIGRTVYCRLVMSPARDALAWLERCEKVQRVAAHASSRPEPNEAPPRSRTNRAPGRKAKRAARTLAAPKRRSGKKAGRKRAARN